MGSNSNGACVWIGGGTSLPIFFIYDAGTFVILVMFGGMKRRNEAVSNEVHNNKSELYLRIVLITPSPPEHCLEQLILVQYSHRKLKSLHAH